MIEREGLQELVPASGGVAVLAGFLERAAVVIEVPAVAGGKLHVLESRWPPRRVRFVTLFARHLTVQARQGIPRLGVVKLLGAFPVTRVMAGGAIFSELA